MKNILHSALTAFSLLILQVAIANTVVVKGIVKDSSGIAVSGKLVKIYSTDSTNQGCLISHNVFTNPNGYYQDTLKCNSDIKKLYILVANCNGTNFTAEPTVTPNSTAMVVVERNFIICAPPAPITNTSCKANFSIIIKDSVVQFNSAASLATSNAAGIALDTILSRIWYFGDSTSILSGNRLDPVHIYSRPGTYTVKLVIKTKLGCESSFSGTVVIAAAALPVGCHAFFTSSVTDGMVTFNSAGSKAATDQDSIISRYWIFGETSSTQNGVLQGNSIHPVHNYARTGKYYVILYIKTKLGCESKYQDSVIINHVICEASAQFSAERVSLKKVNFNSSASKTMMGDSIIQRNWKFGDNTILGGNTISPVKEYPAQGIYTACLQIKTLNGCIAETCKQVAVQDTASRPNISNDFVKILAINPNPVISYMRATIYSTNTVVNAEISIYDIYGVRKSSLTKTLLRGNNIIEMATASLYRGPYFLRVKTLNGTDTRIFYKL